MSKVPDILASIAVAKYRKYARSESELREAFKNAVLAIDDSMKIEAESDNLVRMRMGVATMFKRELSVSREQESLSGLKRPKTLAEYFYQLKGCLIDRVQMLLRYSSGYYELEGQCMPLLLEKFKMRPRYEEKHVTQTELDTAFLECGSFLDSVFVGGMGCDQILSPRPLRSKTSVHDIVVNLSKTRAQLTERLMESVRGATKEILIVGWLGRYIIPELKKCVDRGVELKIVTHRPEEAAGTVGGKDKSEAFSELRQFVPSDNVSLLPSCHARMMLIDERVVFVGSMDLDSQAMAERDEAAIVSDDNEVVARAREFFDDLFNRGTKPKW